MRLVTVTSIETALPLSKPILQVAKYIKFSLHFLIIDKDANKFMNAGFDKSLETLW